MAFVNTEFNKDTDWPDIELLLGSLNLAQDGGFVYNNNLLRLKKEVKHTRGISEEVAAKMAATHEY